MRVKGVSLNLNILEFDALEELLKGHCTNPYLADLYNKVAVIRQRLNAAEKFIDRMPHREG